LRRTTAGLYDVCGTRTNVSAQVACPSVDHLGPLSERVFGGVAGDVGGEALGFFVDMVSEEVVEEAASVSKEPEPP
jgi:hypothetical protein